MSIRLVSLDDASAGQGKDAITPTTPANDNAPGVGTERFPNVDDVLDRLSDILPDVEPQDD